MGVTRSNLCPPSFLISAVVPAPVRACVGVNGWLCRGGDGREVSMGGVR
jgi:hypothetical protein